MTEPRRILFSAQKNEGPFILEWVAYHKAVGFTDIVIVSNDCDDGSDDLLDALDVAGEVTHIRQTVPPDTAPQKNAEAVAREAGLFAPGDWVMWLDLDEYLFTETPRHRVDEAIAAAGEVDAISYAWRFFGDSGVKTWPGRQITAAFHLAEQRRRDRKPQVKTLFRNADSVLRFDIHRPVLKPGTGPDDFRWITSTGRAAEPQFFDSSRQRPFNRITRSQGYYRLGMVLHFAVRTPDVYALRLTRGDGYFAEGKDPFARDEELYSKRNRNQAEDRSFHVMEAPTFAEMERLCSIPGIRDRANAVKAFRWLPLFA